MTRVIADQEMLAALGRAKELVEIGDPNGNVIGFFAPVSLAHAARYAEFAARIDRKELDRRCSVEGGKGRSLREVYEHLLTLTTDPQGQAHLREQIAKLAERDQCTSR
jgi:hypothetical protein